MNQTTKEKAIWTLNKLDKTYKLTSEFLKDIIYVSDSRDNTCVPLDKENTHHLKYIEIIEKLKLQAEKYKYDVCIFHVIVGLYDFPEEQVQMDNYLFVTNEDEFYKENLEEYGCVMAHVENEVWEVKESGSIRVVNKEGLLYRAA